MILLCLAISIIKICGATAFILTITLILSSRGFMK